MKTSNKLLIVVLFIGFILILLLILLKSVDDSFCQDRGGGLTKIRGRVYDFATRELIDSVELKIRYGASGDLLVDTLLCQNDSIRYQFLLPEDDCEFYWLEISNKYYCDRWQFDSLIGSSINKGRVTEFISLLKPATVVHLKMERSVKNLSVDTAFLYFNTPEKEREYWSSFSNSDFYPDSIYFMKGDYTFGQENGRRKISTFFQIESNHDYQIEWIRKEVDYIDTIRTKLTALPFDTVNVHYKFK